MKRLAVYLVALLLPICFLQSKAFSVEASDYVPYPTAVPAISAGSWHTLGLKADGTILAVGWNNHGQLNVSGWEDIVQVVGGDFHTVGIKTDGTVLAVGYNDYGECNVGGWEDIVQVAGSGATVGIKTDGTALAVGYDVDNVESWTDIVQVATAWFHTVGLRDNGSVVAVGCIGLNDAGQCNVESWTDIVQVSAGLFHTLGLKADGTILAVGRNQDGQLNVSGWEDIVQVSAGSSHTVGIKTDGSVVAVGDNDYGQCNVGGWEDIVQVSGGAIYTVGLKTDGSVVAVGDNNHGQCNVGGWYLGTEAPSTTTTSTPQVTTTTSTPQVTTTTTTIQPVPETFSISGHVTGDIKNNVSIILSGTATETVITDLEGYYEFTDLVSGNCLITPEKEEYSFEPPNYVIPNLNGDLYDMDFISTRMKSALPCVAETIYGEQSEETELLRYFRDNVLSQTSEGREIIKLYYQWSPVILKAMEWDEEFKEEIKEMIDGILPLISGEAK